MSLDFREAVAVALITNTDKWYKELSYKEAADMLNEKVPDNNDLWGFLNLHQRAFACQLHQQLDAIINQLR